MGFVATAIALAGAASAGASIYSSNQQAKASKQASEAAAQQNSAAIQAVKDGQNNASTNAAATIKKRVSSASQTVYTSPLGLSGEASTVRKTLLGQ